MLPVLLDGQRVFADQVFGAVFDCGPGGERRAAGAAGGVDLADSVEPLVGHYFDECPGRCNVGFDGGDFHGRCSV